MSNTISLSSHDFFTRALIWRQNEHCGVYTGEEIMAHLVKKTFLKFVLSIYLIICLFNAKHLVTCKNLNSYY